MASPANGIGQRAYAWPLLAVCVALLGATLNNTLPYSGDESYYIGSAIRMVQTGDYAIPVYQGEMRLQKPILAYWMTALGYGVFGIRLWSGRTGFLLMACGLLWLTHRLAALIGFDRHGAGLAVLLLASSTLFLESSRISMTDLPLAFFSLAAFYYFYRALMNATRIRRDLLVAFLAMGLACASKGIVAFVPLAAIVASAFVLRPAGSRRFVLLLGHPLNWLAWAVPGATWYAYVYSKYPDELLRQLQVESADNLVRGLMPILGHLAFYPWAVLTYFPLAAIALVLALRRRQPLPPRLVPLACFAGVLFLGVIVLVQRDKARYLLPAFPMVSLLAADVLNEGRWRALAPKLALGWATLQIVAILIYPVVLGEPVKNLVRYWDGNLHGSLSGYHLPARERNWAMALSRGEIQPDAAGTAFVIVDEKDVAVFPRYEVVQRARRLTQAHIIDHELVTTAQTLLLIRRLP